MSESIWYIAFIHKWIQSSPRRTVRRADVRKGSTAAPAMRERFYSDPRIGQSKNTALEIVTRNRAHFSRELRA